MGDGELDRLREALTAHPNDTALYRLRDPKEPST